MEEYTIRQMKEVVRETLACPVDVGDVEVNDPQMEGGTNFDLRVNGETMRIRLCYEYREFSKAMYEVHDEEITHWSLVIEEGDIYAAATKNLDGDADPTKEQLREMFQKAIREVFAQMVFN